MYDYFKAKFLRFIYGMRFLTSFGRTGFVFGKGEREKAGFARFFPLSNNKVCCHFERSEKSQRQIVSRLLMKKYVD